MSWCQEELAEVRCWIVARSERGKSQMFLCTSAVKKQIKPEVFWWGYQWSKEIISQPTRILVWLRMWAESNWISSKQWRTHSYLFLVIKCSQLVTVWTPKHVRGVKQVPLPLCWGIEESWHVMPEKNVFKERDERASTQQELGYWRINKRGINK